MSSDPISALAFNNIAGSKEKLAEAAHLVDPCGRRLRRSGVGPRSVHAVAGCPSVEYRVNPTSKMTRSSKCPERRLIRQA
jgi:hypothetical protein